MEHETRSSTGLEIRAEPGQRPRLTGYAAVFNSRSLPLPLGDGREFVETIRPGTFKRSLQSDRDILAVMGHDPEAILGRRKTGSLVIGEDERGLRFEVLLNDSDRARNLIEDVRSGNLDGMSFGFRTPLGGDRWDFTKLPLLRELVDVDIMEISVTAVPAYQRTELALRSMAAAQEEAQCVLEQRDLRAKRLAAIEADLRRQ